MLEFEFLIETGVVENAFDFPFLPPWWLLARDQLLLEPLFPVHPTALLEDPAEFVECCEARRGEWLSPNDQRCDVAMVIQAPLEFADLALA